MSASDKQRFELDVFNEFVRIAGLDVEPHSVRQLDPPNPDISCIIAGEIRIFELTLVTDETIETKVRLGRSGYSNFKIEIEDVVSLIRKKSTKKYLGEPIDLVIHEGATPIDRLWLYDQSELNRLVQAETDVSQFVRVWLLDVSNNLVRTFRKA
ncbi:MAG: hypothetical protein ACREPQ_03130 [Rhodanobacter sp.]